jgi:hypothetical protein
MVRGRQVSGASATVASSRVMSTTPAAGASTHSHFLKPLERGRSQTGTARARGLRAGFLGAARQVPDLMK